MKGQGGDDVLSGGGGRDRLLGGPGDDVLTGGAKADVFVFRSGWGADAVTDFAASGRGRDLLDLRGVDVIRGWRDLRAAHLTVDGDDIVIDAGSGDVATLLNVAREDLDRTDFLF
ncbi:MAG: hypothetical protein VYD87_19730 [Pseudomonadota bacterium]|nr:hypothetical protein [Pseudomonadota bacterium]MEE3101610.1 hypothetical protein [Pseudomonadota bacterium]